MTIRITRVPVLVVAFAIGAAAGCASKSSGGGSGAPPDDTLDDASTGGYGGDASTPKDAHADVTIDGQLDCTIENEGCPCADAGANAECKIYFKVGSYEACTIGKTTCSDAGTWGACEGNKLGGDAGK